MSGPLRTNPILRKVVKIWGQYAGQFGGAATVLLGSELLVSDAGCTPLVVLVLAEAACATPGSVILLAEAASTGSVLVLAEAGCGSTDYMLELADDPASPLLTNLKIIDNNTIINFISCIAPIQTGSPRFPFIHFQI